jgi:hypothetical protein
MTPGEVADGLEQVIDDVRGEAVRAHDGLQTTAHADNWREVKAVYDEQFRITDMLIPILSALRALDAPSDEVVEAAAEAIYLSRYAKDGGVWWAVETKDVWRDMARAALTAARGGEG